MLKEEAIYCYDQVLNDPVSGLYPKEFYFQTIYCNNSALVSSIEVAVRTDFNGGWGAYDTYHLVDFCYPSEDRLHSTHYVYRDNVILGFNYWLPGEDSELVEPVTPPDAELPDLIYWNTRSTLCSIDPGCYNPWTYLKHINETVAFNDSPDVTFTSLSGNVFAPSPTITTGPDYDFNYDFTCGYEVPTLLPETQSKPRDPVDIFMKSDFSKLKFPMINGLVITADKNSYDTTYTCNETDDRKRSAIVERRVIWNAYLNQITQANLNDLTYVNDIWSPEFGLNPEFDWITGFDAGAPSRRQKLYNWCERPDGTKQSNVWKVRFPTYEFDDYIDSGYLYMGNNFPLDYCSGKYMFNHEGAYHMVNLPQSQLPENLTPFTWSVYERPYDKELVDYTCPAIVRDFPIKDQCAFDGNKSIPADVQVAPFSWDIAHQAQLNGCHWILSGLSSSGVFIRPLDYNTCIGEITHPEIFLKDPKSEQYYHYLMGDMSRLVTVKEKPIFISFGDDYRNFCDAIDSLPKNSKMVIESINQNKGVGVIETEDIYFVSLKHYSIMKDVTVEKIDYQAQTIDVPGPEFLSDSWVAVTGYHALSSLDMAQMTETLYDYTRSYQPLEKLIFKSPDTWREAIGEEMGQLIEIMCCGELGYFSYWNPFTRCFWYWTSIPMWLFIIIITMIMAFLVYYFIIQPIWKESREALRKWRHKKPVKGRQPDRLYRMLQTSNLDFDSPDSYVIFNEEDYSYKYYEYNDHYEYYEYYPTEYS